jgi:hypothetical protein
VGIQLQSYCEIGRGGRTHYIRFRGEQFRHSQNVRRSRTHLSSAHTHNTPTLPAGLTGPDYPSPEPESQKQGIHDTPAWRAHAFSIVLTHHLQSTTLLDSTSPPSVPPLTLLCLRIIVSAFTTIEFTEDIVPFIPPHLRRDLLRYSAVHSPLSNSKLYALYEPDGHADGEVIVVGPSASLRDNNFRKAGPGTEGHNSSAGEAHDTEVKKSTGDWDSDEWTPTTLHTVVLLSTRLPVSSLLTLPPTITHLALINLPFSVSLNRLPGICPLLVVLDLSYNIWLNATSKEGPKILEKVEWNRWNQLRVVGFRGCQLSGDMLLKVNKGRWEDVDVVQ